MAQKKKREFQNHEYWGRPVPSFGDPKGRVLIVGLAPGAHGANRSGRMFTGDRSGDWLFRALHKAGFANKPTSAHKDDGLKLKDALISAVVHCVPPANKPTTDERNRCLPYLMEELGSSSRFKVIVCLGKFAWDGVLLALSKMNGEIRPKPTFGHNVQVSVFSYFLIGSYHPSQQNTFTGRLTEPMLDSVFTAARQQIKKRKARNFYTGRISQDR